MPASLKNIFRAYVGFTSTANVLGLPKKNAEEHWEGTNFGDKFFPTSALSAVQKRILAGVLEGTGLLLTFSTDERLRTLGYGGIIELYVRGAMVISQIEPKGGDRKDA